MSAESAPSVAHIIQAVTDVQNSLPPGGLVEPQTHIQSASAILGQALGPDVATATGMQEALATAENRLSRAASFLATAQEKLSTYVTMIGGHSQAGQMEAFSGKEPELRTAPRDLPPECLDLASDRMVFEGLLPDGRRAADVLPDDGQTRKFEGPCPVSGCGTIGTITCLGSRALMYKGNGPCARFQKMLDEDR